MHKKKEYKKAYNVKK